MTTSLTRVLWYCVCYRDTVITERFYICSGMSTVTMNLSPVSVKKEMLQLFSSDLIWHRSPISFYFSDAYEKFNESRNLIWIICCYHNIFSKVIHRVTQYSFADWNQGKKTIFKPFSKDCLKALQQFWTLAFFGKREASSFMKITHLHS